MPKLSASLLIAFLISICPPSFSAEFEIVNNGHVIVLEGPIEQGDYEKFLDTVLMGGLPASRVFLASNGGDASEAVKIGKLIRDLGYTTQAPFLLGDTALCNSSLGVSPQSCVCFSACSLIYLAGIERHGDYLGVHRVFLNYADSRNLGLADSIEVSNTLSRETATYLSEMNAPISLIEKINSSSSDQIEILETEYVRDNLEGYIPAYEEWLIARCGSRKMLIDDRGVPEEPEYQRISDCYHKELTKESERSFYKVIQEAIVLANRRFVSPGSVLDYVSNLPSSELVDIIGLEAEDAGKRLSLFGIAQSPPFRVEELVDQQFVFNNSVVVGFDEVGKVYGLEISFIDDSYSSQRRGYTGYFLNNFSSESSPTDFVARFGSPDQSGCFPSGNCSMWIPTTDYNVQVMFDPEERLHSLKVNLQLRLPQ